MQDLDRDVAIHVGLLGLVHRAHAAFADLFYDAELAGDFFAEVRVAHVATRVAPALRGGEESASKTNTIQVASATKR